MSDVVVHPRAASRLLDLKCANCEQPMQSSLVCEGCGYDNYELCCFEDPTSHIRRKIALRMEFGI